MTTEDRIYSIEAAKKAAKRLLKAYKADDTEAQARVARFFDSHTEVVLTRCQLVIAREQGYGSWEQLRRGLGINVSD